MVLCLGLQIGTAETGVFDGTGGTTEGLSDYVRVIGINALAGEGAFALGGIGRHVLNRDRLGGDCSEEEEEEGEGCEEKAEHDVWMQP